MDYRVCIVKGERRFTDERATTISKSTSKFLYEKEEKDYSKYFESVYQPPSLKDAKKRGKEEVKIERDFGLPEEFRNFGTGRKFYIRTYGCQMNEHDTEVMAGIFTALGYEPTFQLRMQM